MAKRFVPPGRRCVRGVARIRAHRAEIVNRARLFLPTPFGRTSNHQSSDSDSSDIVCARNNIDRAKFRARVFVSSSLSLPALRDLFTVRKGRWHFAGSAAQKARSNVSARLPGGRQGFRPHGHCLYVFLQGFCFLKGVLDGAAVNRLGFRGLLLFCSYKRLVSACRSRA